MKKIVLSFLMATSVSVCASAKVSVLCEKKRDQVSKSVCGRSTNEAKKKECVAFYKNAACSTVGLHEVADRE